MSGALQIGLRAGDKIYINGAVIRVDRKVRVELLNDATFLLGSHVMQLADATTPLRQIYFLIQGLLMDPGVRGQLMPAIDAAIADLVSNKPAAEMRQGLESAARHVRNGDSFDALKAIRALLANETAPAAANQGAVPTNGIAEEQQGKKEVAA